MSLTDETTYRVQIRQNGDWFIYEPEMGFARNEEYVKKWHIIKCGHAANAEFAKQAAESVLDLMRKRKENVINVEDYEVTI